MSRPLISAALLGTALLFPRSACPADAPDPPEAAEDAENTDAAEGEIAPPEEWVAEAERAAGSLRGSVIAGVARGKRERVYVEFGGSVVRGRITAASENGITVDADGVSPSLAWAKLLQAPGSELVLKALVPPVSQVMSGWSVRVSLPQPLPWVQGAATELT